MIHSQVEFDALLNRIGTGELLPVDLGDGAVIKPFSLINILKDAI